MEKYIIKMNIDGIWHILSNGDETDRSKLGRYKFTMEQVQRIIERSRLDIEYTRIYNNGRLARVSNVISKNNYIN
jgi:hypothetical protein